MASILRRRVFSASKTLCNQSRLSVTRQCITRIPLSARVPQVHNVRAFTTSIRQLQQSHAVASDESEPVFSRFEDLQETIEQNVLDALTKDMKLETMTEVQQRTLSEALLGVDM
jgi:ATP-dependent RNA helicase MSS116